MFLKITFIVSAERRALVMMAMPYRLYVSMRKNCWPTSSACSAPGSTRKSCRGTNRIRASRPSPSTRVGRSGHAGVRRRDSAANAPDPCLPHGSSQFSRESPGAGEALPATALDLERREVVDVGWCHRCSDAGFAVAGFLARVRSHPLAVLGAIGKLE